MTSTGNLWRRGGIRIRGHLTSWYAFVIVLGGLGLASLFGLTVLRDQVEQRARNAAINTANVAAALMVHRNVTEADFTGDGLTAAEIGDLDADVAILVGEHRLLGLEVWRSDGVSVYPTSGIQQPRPCYRSMSWPEFPKVILGSSPTGRAYGPGHGRSSCRMTQGRMEYPTGSSRC